MIRRKPFRHPCWGWCGQRLLGILENQKLIGEISADFSPTLHCRRPWFTRNMVVGLVCRHDRDYFWETRR